MTTPINVIIMGAAGRDFHNFNCYFRNNENYNVVAFTATQIPNIEGRRYPPKLAGKLYPDGIPIYAEEELDSLIKKHKVNQVIFAYSDIAYHNLMHKASAVLAAGADFRLMGADATMIQSSKPVISICAVRTGCGKSQTTRKVVDVLKCKGKQVVVIRHPMPYGDLEKQEVQRFASLQDLDLHQCTIEEREEYEPHIVNGTVVYAGVDYEKILRQAETEADIILWDGGNNDLSFYKSDVEMVVVDPHRPGHEIAYYPGETNLRRATVIIINKMATAEPHNIDIVRQNIEKFNPCAKVIEADSPLFVENSEQIRQKRVLVIEDGPTLTHGEMSYGAGVIAAKKFGASELINPRPFAVGSLIETYKKYPHIGALLPAMGYGDEQIKELEETINNTDCDLVVSATPIKIQRLININKPILNVRYELQEIGYPNLEDVLKDF